MHKRVVITGATGLIGTELINKLIENNYAVTILTRNKSKAENIHGSNVKVVESNYHEKDLLKDVIENSYAVINLAGENIASKRWSRDVKQSIYNSRIYSTRSLVESITACKQKPKVFISASAVGYYPFSETETFDEHALPGKHYLAYVCKEWESEAKKVNEYGVRVVNPRISVVLSKDGGALKKMLPAFKMFAGGKIGQGNQWFPWIHIEDIVNIFLEMLENENYSGPVNCVAPESVTMSDFVKTLGKTLNRPSSFPVPGFAVKLLMGQGADYVLNGSNVLPGELNKNNFTFKYGTLSGALNNLLK